MALQYCSFLFYIMKKIPIHTHYINFVKFLPVFSSFFSNDYLPNMLSMNGKICLPQKIETDTKNLKK